MIKTILLIEDNPDDAELALLALQKSGVEHKVIHVADGHEAVKRLIGAGRGGLHEAVKLPDLVLLDLKLPKVSGMDVLRQLRADQRAGLIPVVILSTSKEPRDLVMAYRLGANSFVHKSVNFSEFTDAMRMLCAYWLTVNQFPPQLDSIE